MWLIWFQSGLLIYIQTLKIRRSWGLCHERMRQRMIHWGGNYFPEIRLSYASFFVGSYWHSLKLRTIVFIEQRQSNMLIQWWEYCQPIRSWRPIIPQWASYLIRNVAGCACAWNAGNVLANDFEENGLVTTPACITPRAPHTFCDACREC